MKSMHKFLWAAFFLLCLSILIETTIAKGGRGSRSSSRSSRSSRSTSSGRYSGMSRSYYYGANRFFYHNTASNTTGSMTAGGGIVIALVVICSIGCIGVYCWGKFMKKPLCSLCFPSLFPDNSVSNDNMEEEYAEAQVYQKQNVPEASPPDFNVENPLMLIETSATKTVQQSISINDAGNIVQFLDKNNVQDRCVVSNIRIKYFEVTIDAKENQTTVFAVGFCSKPYPPMRLPGWETNSVAYHSDNGNALLNMNEGEGNSYGPSYSAGDTVGCGYVENSDGSQSFFFTKNGEHLGTAFTTDVLSGETFACVGADGNCTCTINFGKDGNKHLQWIKPEATSPPQPQTTSVPLAQYPAPSSQYPAPENPNFSM